MRALRMLAVLAVCLAVPAAAQALPLLPTDASVKHNLQVRPFEIDFTGDGSGWLGGFDGTGRYSDFGRMRWPQWNQKQAMGRGAVWLNDCTPDCAGGTYHAYAVTVYATDVRANVFMRLTMRYRYQGKPIVYRPAIHEFTNGRHHAYNY